MFIQKQSSFLRKIKLLIVLAILLGILLFYLIPVSARTGLTKSQPTLMGDPINLEFSTFLGGINQDEGLSIATADDGSNYVIGDTESSNFPTRSAYDNSYNGLKDAYIAKFSASGSLLWCTLFGGNESDSGNDIAVTSNGDCYIVGSTNSKDFPVLNGFNETYGGNSDVFVAKFSSTGSLIWSTYLGGDLSESGKGISLTSDGSCVITGYTFSENFPTLNAYNATYNNQQDVFVTKFSSSGTLLWSTYFGGSNIDIGNGISVVNEDSCYIIGQTWSNNFPIQNAFDNSLGGSSDIFISKFSIDGSLLWSTFYGGDDHDVGYGIDCGEDGSCYFTGPTWSTNFPTLNAFDAFGKSGIDAFVVKFSESGNPIWSTYLSGTGTDTAEGIAVASDGSCFVTGRTESTLFPTLDAYNSTYGGNSDAYITKFSSDGLLLSSSFLGGSGYDFGVEVATNDDGSCVVVGSTGSINFPTFNAYNATFSGCNDAFIMRFYDKSIEVPSFGFLTFIVIMPIILIISRRRRKQ